MSVDGDRRVRVKMYVHDGNSYIPAQFEATAWDANEILLAYMDFNAGEAGAIEVDGAEWEGFWRSPECFAFVQALVPHV